LDLDYGVAHIFDMYRMDAPMRITRPSRIDVLIIREWLAKAVDWARTGTHQLHVCLWNATSADLDQLVGTIGPEHELILYSRGSRATWRDKRHLITIDLYVMNPKRARGVGRTFDAIYFFKLPQRDELVDMSMLYLHGPRNMCLAKLVAGQLCTLVLSDTTTPEETLEFMSRPSAPTQ
jgi:hypothetical protein